MREINKAILFTRKNIGLCEKIEEHRNQNKIPVPDTACIEWETILAALEKQIPKKPVWNCKNEVIHCPNCDYDLMGGIEVDSEHDPKYCWACGQKLDWSEDIERD